MFIKLFKIIEDKLHSEILFLYRMADASTSNIRNVQWQISFIERDFSLRLIPVFLPPILLFFSFSSFQCRCSFSIMSRGPRATSHPHPTPRATFDLYRSRTCSIPPPRFSLPPRSSFVSCEEEIRRDLKLVMHDVAPLWSGTMIWEGGP